MRWHITIEASCRHWCKNHKKYERKNHPNSSSIFTSAKLEILYSGIFLETTYGNILETICREIFRKLRVRCVNTIENLDDTHPGCRELIQDKGLSV